MKKFSLLVAITVLSVGVFGFSPIARAADQYSWSASYFLNVNAYGGAPTPKRPAIAKEVKDYQGGPFSSQNACIASFSANDSSIQKTYPGSSLQSGVGENGTGLYCTCTTPIATQQTSIPNAQCPGYTPPAQPACSFSNNFACPSGQTCNSGTCVATPQAPAQTAAPGSGGSEGGSAGTGFTALAPIPGLTQGAVANSTGLAQFLNNLYKYLVGLAATLAVIEIIIGGLQISIQKDSISKKSEGRRRIEQALLGLVLVLSPALVFGIINPSILNLSVSIPPLQTQSKNGGSLSGGTGTPPTSVDKNTGCTVTGTELKKASCPTSQAAQSWAAACQQGGAVLPCQTTNSSGCTDSTYYATCQTTAGPYTFIDTSQAGFTFSGTVNAIVGYSHYEPLAASASDPNNGTDAVNFANTCTADGGSICLSSSVFSTACTYNSSQSTSQSNTCYSKTLTCEPYSFVWDLLSCSRSPQFTIIQ